MDDKEKATEKAIEIVNMNVAKTRLLDPVSQNSVGVTTRPWWSVAALPG